jgi:hypothetical protein
VLAALQLAVGHLAGDRFPEAAEALRAADAFFSNRGAERVVSDYRAKAGVVKANSAVRATRAVADPQPAGS